MLPRLSVMNLVISVMIPCWSGQCSRSSAVGFILSMLYINYVCNFLHVFLFLRCLEYDACRTDSEECAVFYHSSFFVAKYLVIDESAGVARTVSECVFQLALLVAAHCYCAVVDVDTRVAGFDRSVGLAALHVSADDIVSHLQRDHLLVVEYILDYHNRTDTVGIGVLIGIFLLLGRL